jgi:hypothetical protein
MKHTSSITPKTRYYSTCLTMGELAQAPTKGALEGAWGDSREPLVQFVGITGVPC